jgi:hypothetical protein
MNSDPIVAEIRRIREELAAKFNYDTGAIVEDARQRHLAGNREVLRRPPRQPAAPVKAKPQLPPAAATERS